LFSGSHTILIVYFLTVMGLLSSCCESDARHWENIQGKSYDTFTVRLDNYDLVVRHSHDGITIDSSLQPEWKRVRFATNGGMFHPDFSPVGLLVDEGREIRPINEADGTGNFYLKPNGVFLIDWNKHALIIPSDKYRTSGDNVRIATQSGPLLALDGQINSNFSINSQNRQIRSGVGINVDSDVVFAISNEPVTFYEFGQFFLDELACKNALYLDGAISEFYVPALDRKWTKLPFGIVLAVLEAKK